VRLTGCTISNCAASSSGGQVSTAPVRRTALHRTRLLRATRPAVCVAWSACATPPPQRNARRMASFTPSARLLCTQAAGGALAAQVGVTVELTDVQISSTDQRLHRHDDEQRRPLRRLRRRDFRARQRGIVRLTGCMKECAVAIARRRRSASAPHKRPSPTLSVLSSHAAATSGATHKQGHTRKVWRLTPKA
jgi:hypothetical protein